MDGYSLTLRELAYFSRRATINPSTRRAYRVAKNGHWSALVQQIKTLAISNSDTHAQNKTVPGGSNSLTKPSLSLCFAIDAFTRSGTRSPVPGSGFAWTGTGFSQKKEEGGPAPLSTPPPLWT